MAARDRTPQRPCEGGRCGTSEAEGNLLMNESDESRDSHDSEPEETVHETHSVSRGYVLGQLAHAFTTSQRHDDPATRERATATVARWIQVFQGILSGTLTIGSRTPVAE